MLPDGPESETERNGFLSSAAEAHAFGLGLYDGLFSVSPRPGEMRDNRDVDKEPQYYALAYLLATGVQFGAFLAVLWVVLSAL